ncbi:MAG: aminoglycoside phosphotransferase family protein [Dehalococcoidia bacterium]
MPALPPGLLARVEETLGSSVVTIEALHGGFTIQSNCRLTLQDGRQIVLKAAAPEPVDGAPGRTWTELFDREIWVYRHVPQAAPWRPGTFGDVEADGWLGLLMEDLSAARRVPPWRDEDLDAVAEALAGIHQIPKPDRMPPDLIGRIGRQSFWERIRQRGRQAGHLPPELLSADWWEWLKQILPVAERAYDQLENEEIRRTFNHNDVRSDNMFIRDGRPVLLDWGQAIWDTPARDSVYWSLGIERETGIPAMAVHRRYLAYAPDPGDDAVRGVIAFWGPYFIDRLQTGGVWTDNQRLRAEYLGPSLRWLVEALDLPPMPTGGAP